MASASAGLELPATILIAPLLGRIAGSWREAPLPRALITRRRQGWQYDGQAGPGFVPVDSGDSGAGPRTGCAPRPNRPRPAGGLATPSDLVGSGQAQPAVGFPSPTFARNGEGARRFAKSPLVCERDGVDVAPVVGLVAVGAAAIAEEPRCIGIGAVAEVLDPAHAGGGEAGGDITGEIEQGGLRRRRGPEESFVRSIPGLEAGDEFGADLVIRLADGRPERDRNARAVGAAPLHGGDRRFEDAGGGAAPAGMGDPDDAGRFVGEQDGAAVGGGDA